jgi:putative transcriptional regulator
MKCNIRELRKKAGLTQKDFAALLQTSVSHVSRLETGKHLPSLPVAYRIAKTLCCLIEDLYDFEN